MNLLSIMHLCVAILIMLAGCDISSIDSESYRTEVAEIYTHFVSFRAEAPVILSGVVVSGLETEYHDRISSDTVRVLSGVSFEVTTEAFGLIEDRAASSIVAVEGQRATIRVRNDNRTGVVRLALKRFTRTDRIAFSQPGLAEVVIEGVERNMQTGHMEPRQMRFPVKVLPR